MNDLQNRINREIAATLGEQQLELIVSRAQLQHMAAEKVEAARQVREEAEAFGKGKDNESGKTD